MGEGFNSKPLRPISVRRTTRWSIAELTAAAARSGGDSPPPPPRHGRSRWFAWSSGAVAALAAAALVAFISVSVWSNYADAQTGPDMSIKVPTSGCTTDAKCSFTQGTKFFVEINAVTGPGSKWTRQPALARLLRLSDHPGVRWRSQRTERIGDGQVLSASAADPIKRDDGPVHHSVQKRQ